MTKIIETPTLETKRLVLRPLVLNDAPALQKFFNNWNIIKHLNENIPWPYPEDGTYTFFKNDCLPRMKKRQAVIWTITLDSNPIGLIEYRDKPKFNTDQENRGFWIGEPYWNKGYITEAVFAVNDFVFFNLGVDKMILDNFKDNTASRRIKEKTGSTYLHDTTRPHRGGEIEMEIWELTAENWNKFREENP